MKIRKLGLRDYQEIWQNMRDFTDARTADTEDELWLLQHYPVYTQGQAGKPEHLLNPEQIPVIQTDRGGQITYHGPGQMMGYVLMDIKKRKMGVKNLVSSLENIIIRVLSLYDIEAESRCKAPGVYVNDSKIASIGLRVRNGCSYHGIALNVNMDLKPFKGINPCGFSQLEMTQIADFKPDVDVEQVCRQFSAEFVKHFES